MHRPNPKLILSTLEAVRRRLLRAGWAPGREQVDAKGRGIPFDPKKPMPLIDALLCEDVSIERHIARSLLRRMAGDEIVAWGAHPYRTAQEVFLLLDKAIVAAGGRPPIPFRPPQIRTNKGGWIVSCGPSVEVSA